MKKRTLALSVILSLSMAIPAYAGIGMILDGHMVSFTDATGRPMIDANSRTLVPLRAAMEAYGCDVKWDEQSQTATVSKNGTIVQIPVGRSHIIANGQFIMNDTSAKIHEGRVYLPIRAVLEAFGADVDWDTATNSVSIKSDTKKKQEEEKQKAYEERQKEIEEFNRQIEEDIKKRQEESKKRQDESKKAREELDAKFDELRSKTDELLKTAEKYSKNNYVSPYDSISNSGGYGNSYAISQGYYNPGMYGGYGSTYAEAAYQQYLDNLLVQSRYK